MANHELLNNEDHKDLRVITTRSAEYGDSLWFAPTFWREFRSVQACYPILFQKNETQNTFIPLALFGFQENENLFLTGEGWDAEYIPLSIQRMPFYIGFQKIEENGQVVEKRVITVDMDSPRVNSDEGAELFLEFGGNSDYLESMASILETLHQGVEENSDFIQALESNALLEPVTLDIELMDGSKNQMMGFSTINEDALNKLDGESLIDLHKKGYLQAAYTAILSQVKFKELVKRKNERVNG